MQTFASPLPPLHPQYAADTEGIVTGNTKENKSKRERETLFTVSTAAAAAAASVVVVTNIIITIIDEIVVMIVVMVKLLLFLYARVACLSVPSSLNAIPPMYTHSLSYTHAHYSHCNVCMNVYVCGSTPSRSVHSTPPTDTLACLFSTPSFTDHLHGQMKMKMM